MAKTLTIRDLLDIDPGRIQKSQELLKVILEDQYNILKEENIFQRIARFLGLHKAKMFYTIYKYKVYSNSGSVYTVFIKVSPHFEEKKFLDNKIQVFCQCADFKYRVAYGLHKRDNVFINQVTKDHLGIALTTPPTRVDTSNLCKHLYAVIDEFKSQLPKLIVKK